MILFLIALILLLYTYLGYPAILLMIVKCRRRTSTLSKTPYFPSISVIIAAYNEEGEIEDRITNILSCDYPSDLLEVVVASDGSTDRTVEIAESYEDSRVVVLAFDTNRGRALVHSEAAAIAKGEILTFSDAQSRFPPTFFRDISTSFAVQEVGCVTNEIDFVNRYSTALSQSRSMYWRFEYLLRELSSQAGILAVASGACMAVRGCLFRPLDYSTDDVDFVTPIDIVTQGYRVVHRGDIVVTEHMYVSRRSELQSRIRMTSRNWIGTWRRLKSCSIKNYAWLWWSLISHKFLRWLTPLFLLTIFVGSALEWSNPYLRAFCCVQVFMYAWASIGLFLPSSTPGWLGAPTSFCIANVGFALGILSALFGRVDATYDRRKEKINGPFRQGNG